MDDNHYTNFREFGKPAINNLLWEWLPGATTLDEAENIACEIYRLIDAQHERTKHETDED